MVGRHGVAVTAYVIDPSGAGETKNFPLPHEVFIIEGASRMRQAETLREWEKSLLRARPRCPLGQVVITIRRSIHQFRLGGIVQYQATSEPLDPRLPKERRNLRPLFTVFLNSFLKSSLKAWPCCGRLPKRNARSS